MALNVETEALNGFHRASTRLGDGTLLYCESACLDTAALWLAEAQQLLRIEALPEGVTLGSSGRRQFQFRREIPFGFDFHWVREVALDVLRGTTGFRLDGGVTAGVTAAIDAPFDLRVCRTGNRLRLRLNSSASRSAGLELKAAAQVSSEIGPAPAGDTLLAALAGIHPLEWIRTMLAASGSSFWRALADAASVRTYLLDAIHSGWQQMSACAEAAVWRALGDEDELAGLLQAARATLAGNPLQPVPGSAAEEWLRSSQPAESAEAARALLSWLGRPQLAEAAAQLRRYALTVLDTARPADWAEFVLAEQAGCRPGEIDPASLINRWAGLRDSIYHSAANALNRQLAAELTAGVETASGQSCLLDVSFPATPEGAAALRSAASGNLEALFAPGSPAEVHSGWLSNFHARRRYLDLHLPFLGRRQYWNALDAVASASVVNEGVGRIAVYTLQARDRAYQSGLYTSTCILAAAVSERDGQARCDNLNLTFEHRFDCSSGSPTPAWTRLLGAYGVLPAEWPKDVPEAVLTITAAVARMSTTLQLLMRRWIPALYFADPHRYENLGAAWPLLVFAAGTPSRDPRTYHFTYDAMDPNSVRAAAFSASAALPAMMEDVRARLSAAGLTKKLSHYTPYRFEGLIHQSVRSPQFAALLRADAFLVQDMVRLAETGREFRSLWSRQPGNVIRRLSTDGAYFVRSFNSRLKRLFGGPEFLALGPLILAEATAALSGPSARPAANLECVDSDGRRLVWTN
ncbi:MAG: hypothetical protein IH602_18345 [Bryobacteraceae bacterium]|nr:hypothetical protein [Bryobacteraceae bacterium]